MNNPPYVTVKYSIWHFLKIPLFLFFKCSVKKLHKHYENVRGSEHRGHTYAGYVKFFNHLDFKFFWVEAPEIFFYAIKYILRYSSIKYIFICH